MSTKFRECLSDKMKPANVFLVLLLILVMSVPALAHVITADWPRITFTVNSEYEVGSIIDVSADTQNVTSVSWRLLCNGQGMPVYLSEDGGSILVSKAGNYILRGVARNGTLASSHTVFFDVNQSDTAGETLNFSMRPVNSVYSESGSVQIAVNASNVSSVDWSLTIDGVPVEFAHSLSIFGGSFKPLGVGNYNLTALVHGTDGTTFPETISFSVVADPTLRLNVPAKAAVNTPVAVRLETSGVEERTIKAVLNKDGSKEILSGFTTIGGTVTFPDTGWYEIEVSGYDAAQQIMVSDTAQIMVAETVDDQPLAGSVEAGVNRRAIFEWTAEHIAPEYEPLMHTVMRVLDCDIIFQSFSDQSTESILDYVERRASDGHQVYYLCGESTWATETDAASMMAELERVIEINKAAEKAGTAKLYGILYDVEGLNQEKKMNQVVENYKAIYQVAKEHGIKINACISYYLDSRYGFETQLEDLIANGCDSVSIMNYYKRNTEADNIQTEVALCEKYGKGLTNITEMQPVGSHDLTQDNTYHDDGIDAVEAMWRSLDDTFAYDIGYAYHYMKPIIELLELES